MSENFKLPSSSYEELVKIIKAYSTGKVGQPVTLDSLAQSTSMDKTVISGNNGFLVQLELITEGKAKSPTEKGQKLGRAYIHNVIDDVINIWCEIIDNNEFLSRMLSAVRIRNGMDRINFVNHIIYSSGLNTNNKSKAGAGAVVEILKCAGLVTESDGKITVTQSSPMSKSDNNNISNNENITEPTTTPTSSIENKFDLISQLPTITSNKCQIVLNININSSVDDLDVLAEKIKLFIKEISE